MKLAVILLVAAATCASASDWRVDKRDVEPSSVPNVEHHTVSLTNDAGGSATLQLVVFPTSAATLRVIDNASGNDSLADAASRANCVGGVNGGYFDPQFAPIGLRVIDGVMTKPLVRARLLTGVLSASRERGVEIVRLGEFSKRRKFDAGMECGPFLVDLGAAVKTLNNERAARRTFAAVARGGKAALGACSSVTLAELGEILASKPLDGFAVWRAMNLDGGSSTAFWCKKADGSVVSAPEQKTVRDFVGVVAK